MRKILLSFILILCFNSSCYCTCTEQIRTFYLQYMENMLHDQSKNKTLCKEYLSEELLEKIPRMIRSTNIDPVVRAQDMNLDAIETLNINFLTDNWYMVSYYWNKKENSTLTEIPVKAENINGNCKITYITPIWNETQYGDNILYSIN